LYVFLSLNYTGFFPERVDMPDIKITIEKVQIKEERK